VSKKHKKSGNFVVPELGRRVNRRPNRVADAIRNELSTLLLQESRDARLAGVHISKVEVSPDLKMAYVYFSCPEENKKHAQAGLSSAKGFMRSSLAKRMVLRCTPKLVFKYDLAVVYQQEMDQIFREIANERQEP
jgi:ribosome-binding factor A